MYLYIFANVNILRAGIIFFDDRRKINILKDMFEKEMKLQFLSMLFLRIICLIFAFCLVQNRANAQETLRANGMDIIANARVNEVEVPSLNGGDAISIANNSMLPMQGNLSDSHLPAIQKRKIAGRASAAVNVSGIVDASTLADDAELVLTGNTNLFMDVNKTLKCISGDYSLTLSGGNLLTLNNSTGYAIDVSSLTISAPLNVKSSCVAVAAKTGMTINSTVNATSTDTGIGTVSGTLTINADVTVTTNSSAAILNRGLDNGGDIIINNGVIKATGANSGTWAYGIAARGSITSQAGTIINATGGTGIYAEEGNIHLAGDVVSIAKGETGSGVYAEAGEVSLSTISVPSSQVGISANNGLTLNGDVEVNSANTGIGTVNGTPLYIKGIGKDDNIIGLNDGSIYQLNMSITINKINVADFNLSVHYELIDTSQSNSVLLEGHAENITYTPKQGNINYLMPRLAIIDPESKLIDAIKENFLNNFDIKEFKIYHSGLNIKQEIFIERNGINFSRVNKYNPAYNNMPVESLVGDTFIAKISWLNAQNADFEYNLHFTIDSVKKNLEMDMITYTNDGSVIFNKDFNSNQSLIFSSNSEGYFLMKLPVVASLSSKFSLSLRSKNRTEILITQKINN